MAIQKSPSEETSDALQPGRHLHRILDDESLVQIFPHFLTPLTRTRAKACIYACAGEYEKEEKDRERD
jgi:hypothetical protein